MTSRNNIEEHYANPDKLAVVFAADLNFILPLTVAAHSTVSSCTNPVSIVILHIGIDEGNRQKVSNILSNAGQDKRCIHWMELKKEKMSSFPFQLKHISMMAYARIFAPDLLKESHNRILYLDCDIVVNTDVSQLKNWHLNGATIGAVRDFLAPYWSSSAVMRYVISCEPLLKDYDSFNSGALLVDTRKWSQDSCLQKCLDFIQKYQEQIHSDQDALNYVLRDSWCRLPPQYNLQTEGFKNDAILPEDEMTEISNTLINKAVLHFCTNHKPWNSGLRKGRTGAALWMKALKNTKMFSSPSLFFYRLKRSYILLSDASRRLINYSGSD